MQNENISGHYPTTHTHYHNITYDKIIPKYRIEWPYHTLKKLVVGYIAQATNIACNLILLFYVQYYAGWCEIKMALPLQPF